MYIIMVSHSAYIGVSDLIDTHDAPLPPRSKDGVSKSIDIDVNPDYVSAFRESRALSHSLLQAYGSCRLKGDMIVGENPSLQPTTFAQAHMRSGTEFERAAIDNISLWGRRIDLVGEKFPMGTTQVLIAGMTRTDRITHFEYELSKLDEGPKIFLQVPLYLKDGESVSGIKGAALDGVADIMIWTGKTWIIGDTKCSETAQASYGNQITLYYKIWRKLYPDREIHPTGFIAHCGEGMLYNSSGSRTSKMRCIRNITVTPIPYALYEKSLQQAFEYFKHPCRDITFKTHCIECQFRYHCYRKLLLDSSTTDISLFPGLSPASIDSLRSTGIRSVEDLRDQFLSGKGHEWFDLPSAMLPYLIGRATAVIKFKGFCSISIPEDLLTQSAFVAYSTKLKEVEVGVLNRTNGTRSRKKLSEVDEGWFLANLGVKVPAYVVSYTPQEANNAYHIEDGKLKRLGGKRVSLLEIVRDDIQLPLTSYGLPEIVALLEYVVAGDTRAGIQQWHERIDMSDPEEAKYAIVSPEKVDHLSYLELCLHYIHRFGALCRKEELLHVT